MSIKNHMEWQATPKKEKTKKESDEEEEKNQEEEISDDEESLEDKIEENEEELEDIEFEEFFEQPELIKTNPSLRKINPVQRNTFNLEENLIESTGFDKNNSNNEDFKYSIETGNKDEPKYMHYENTFNPLEKKELGFQSSPEASLGNQVNFEKYNPVSKLDKEKTGKENIFEKREIKYKPSN